MRSHHCTFQQHTVELSLIEAYLCECGKPISLCKEHFLEHDSIQAEMLYHDPRLCQTICSLGIDFTLSEWYSGCSCIPLCGSVVGLCRSESRIRRMYAIRIRRERPVEFVLENIHYDDLMR